MSHETIYLSLFVQGRGALRKELTRVSAPRARHPPPPRRTRSYNGQGKLRDIVHISERPAEADDRAVPGHWEGDLLLGHLDQLHRHPGRAALPVRDAGQDPRPAHLPSWSPRRWRPRSRTLPTALFQSLTWDQGKEMSEHAKFTIDTGVQVYFCDPRSPWQRGSNENTNGLLRQYFPKGKSMAGYTQADLDAVADQLNGRPRQTLGWKTPSQTLDAGVAMTG